MRKSLVFVVCFVASFVLIEATAQAVTYRLPVTGNITDTYRPPATKYGAGNRGWQYSTTPGSDAKAAADGTVTFAGQVGGVLNVVVAHDDGVLTTYAQLASIDVHKGQQVKVGQKIGITGAGFYFGARRKGEYIDPASLFRTRVYLVPLNSRPAAKVAEPVTPSEIAWLGRP